MDIKIQLMGTPKCWESGRPINIPYKKAEALLYYLLVEKKASRDELAGLFWGEFPEDKALKNLRNSIYILKKALVYKFIENAQSVVIMDPVFLDSCDIDIYKKSGVKYAGDFLQGFFLKDDSGYFEKWVEAQRQRFRDRYREEIFQLIRNDFDVEKLDNIEKYANFLIELDELDERPWRILMRYYLLTGSQYKAVRTYEKLVSILRYELEVGPSKKTQELYAEVIETISNKQIDVSSQDFFYGRDLELQFMKCQFEHFIQSKKCCHILIQGEAGVGKTRLKNEFLKEYGDRIILMNSQCYQSEKNLYLKPWSGIFSDMGRIMEEDGIPPPHFWSYVVPYLTPDTKMVDILNVLRYQMAEEVVLNMLDTISKKKKVLMVIEDLQWIDSISLSLLNNLVIRGGNNLFLVITLRDEHDRSFDKMISQWTRFNHITTIELTRFTPMEVADFVRLKLSDMKKSPLSMEAVYRETEGNVFFLVEYLNYVRKEGDSISKKQNIMTRGMKDILRSKFYDLSQEALEVANLVSIFFDKIPVNIIGKMSNMGEAELIGCLEELEEQGILRQSGVDFREYEFTHQKLRELAYKELSSPRRAQLHEMAARAFEAVIDKYNSHLMYPRLIYHYESAFNSYKKLVYQIKNIKLYLDFRHEFFPSLIEWDDEKKYLSVSREELMKQLHEIERGLIQLQKENYSPESVADLQIEYLHIKGRQLIRKGRYIEGIENIKEMISKALFSGSYVKVLEGYKQIIYYYLQIDDTVNMAQYIEEALELAVPRRLKSQEGMLLRLKGFGYLMDGKFGLAEKYLMESIDIFKELCRFNDKYILNIAASYNYLGDVRKDEGNYFEALSYYEKAMEICERKKVPYGLYMFYTNVGQIHYLLGKYEKSLSFFQQGMVLFEQIDVTWGRSVAESYIALLLIRQGDIKRAHNYLSKAQRHAGMMNSPYEMKILERNWKEAYLLMNRAKNETAGLDG